MKEQTIITQNPDVEGSGIEMNLAFYNSIKNAYIQRLRENGRLMERTIMGEVKRDLIEDGVNLQELELKAVLLDLISKGSIQREGGNEPIYYL